MATDPLRGVALHIGNAQRTFKWSMRASRIAFSKFPGRELPELLHSIGHLNDHVLCEVAAAQLIDSTPTTSDKVAAWLEAEPELKPQLVQVLIAAINEAIRRMVKSEVPAGEAPPAPPPMTLAPDGSSTEDGPTTPASSD